MMFGRKLERDLNRASLKNDKLKKEKVQLKKNTQQAENLFRETLKVKLQYEELMFTLS